MDPLGRARSFAGNARPVDLSATGGSRRETAEAAPDGRAVPAPPTIALPKGGGAVRGIGEKFAANPVTGTGTLTVPIATSPARAGFGPALSLSYDSGAANGPFGYGWSLSLPSITRKTDRGLPQYRDADESDVFILSGAEDLVPKLVESDSEWQRHDVTRTVDDVDYRIRLYRPRVDGLFARIERWIQVRTGETHWRSITRDNVTTLYGRDNNSRIFDPADPDPDHPTRIFSWLICASYDDKGNAIAYEYKEEDSAGVALSQAHEANRTPRSRAAQRYLKRVRYGNRVSRLRQPDLSDADWMFEMVLDYGEHAAEAPHPHDTRAWLCRRDPFSSYRAAFEVRTYRLCRRVLMFHHFPDQEIGANCLVRSTDLTYREDPAASFLIAVTQCGYQRQGPRYLMRSLPPLELTYSRGEIDETVRELDEESLANLPAGLDGVAYQWVDLNGEGLSGILTEQAGGWYHKPNLGGSRFGVAEPVATRPSLAALSSGGQQLPDLAGDGLTDLVRIRNGEVCYWPNLGYGRSGARVAMDMAHALETRRQVPHALRGPAQRRHRVAFGGGRDQPLQIGPQGRILREGLLAATSRPAAPSRGQPPGGLQFLEPTLNRGIRDPRSTRHAADATPSCHSGLCGRQEPARTLRQGRGPGLLLRPAELDIHATIVRPGGSYSCSYFLTLPYVTFPLLGPRLRRVDAHDAVPPLQGSEE